MAATLAPGPKHPIPGADLFAYRRDPLGFLTRIAREYGDVATFKLGPLRLFLLNHPDHVKDLLVTHSRNFVKSRALERTRLILGEGLLTSEGDLHLRHRRMIRPIFHRERINGYGGDMVDLASATASRWRDGDELDIYQEMMRLTLRIVGRTLFGSEVEGEAEEIGRNITTAMNFWNVLLLPYSDLLFLLPLPAVRRFEKARAQLDDTVYGLIGQRRASADERDDLLSLLLASTDTEGYGERLTDAQVRDEALTLFTAGHETTALATTWTWLLLSQNTDAEARLHEELDSVLRGRLPTVADIPQLPYTRMVAAEAMRIYPPAWAIGRRAREDCEFGGYRVPADSIVLVSQYVTHRDERFFPEPLSFKPERWSPAQRERVPRFAYYPFGAGTRVCIGESFAWTEIVLILAVLAQTWRLRSVSDEPVELNPLITLRPKNPVWMRAERRWR